MPVFTRATPVSATPAELYRFHENPHNLRRILPAGVRILDLRAAEGARPGEEFLIALRRGPVILRWTGRWRKADPPGLLVDDAVRSPFLFWRHHHIFTPRPGGSLLTDRVEFRLPWRLGGPVGDAVCRWLVFPRLFAARHLATRNLFGPGGV